MKHKILSISIILILIGCDTKSDKKYTIFKNANNTIKFIFNKDNILLEAYDEGKFRVEFENGDINKFNYYYHYDSLNFEEARFKNGKISYFHKFYQDELFLYENENMNEKFAICKRLDSLKLHPPFFYFTKNKNGEISNYFTYEKSENQVRILTDQKKFSVKGCDSINLYFTEEKVFEKDFYNPEEEYILINLSNKVEKEIKFKNEFLINTKSENLFGNLWRFSKDSLNKPKFDYHIVYIKGDANKRMDEYIKSLKTVSLKTIDNPFILNAILNSGYYFLKNGKLVKNKIAFNE